MRFYSKITSKFFIFVNFFFDIFFVTYFLYQIQLLQNKTMQNLQGTKFFSYFAADCYSNNFESTRQFPENLNALKKKFYLCKIRA